MSAMMIIFLVLILGYALGSVTVAGLSLGTSGVLLVALVFGHFGLQVPGVIQDFGLILFVTSVGFIAGPAFFRSFKSKVLSYVILGFLIIAVGTLVCVVSILFLKMPTGLTVGLLSGALTSTPGLAAALEASGDVMASVGYGIAYPFGVVGVVLFVQLVPKLLHVDLIAEAEKINVDPAGNGNESESKATFSLDSFGYFSFAAAVAAGLLIAQIEIPLPGGAAFNLGTSGGPLLTGLLMGHFGHAGALSLSVPVNTLKPLRELGLALFLLGAGCTAGKGFIEVLGEYGVRLFFVGALMTLFPMALGYLVAKRAMRLEILNALGSICGGMTSTPALGTLISVAKTDAVTTAYAATYPVALIFVVLACQFIAKLL